MTTRCDPSTADVLLVESHPHVGDGAALALESAGHRVHRCHPDPLAADCAAMPDDGRCPIDDGIDVAVLVRRPLEPTPTHLEDGVRCARRAGIPIVEQGPEHPDPWARAVDVRLEPDRTDLAGVTETMAHAMDAPAEAAIQRALVPLMQAAGMDPSAVTCRLERSGTSLTVHVTLPRAADLRLRSAISVRVLDGVRAAATRTFGNVDVDVHPSLEGSGG